MTERTKKFTNIEFKNLPRYANGDLTNLAEDFIWITDSQVRRLSEDDFFRIDEYQEEMSYMAEDAKMEFNNKKLWREQS